MSVSQADTFRCPACSAPFAWKPQFAGRKIRCRCGEVFTAAAPPAGPALDPDAYDLAPDPPPRSALAASKAKPAPAPRAAADGASPPPAPPAPSAVSEAPTMYAYAARRRRSAEAGEPEAASPVRNFYVPAALLVLGVGMRFGQLMFFSDSPGNKWAGHTEAPSSPAVVATLIVCELILSLAVMLAGATIASKLLDADLGSVGSAALKLSAMVVFAAGAASLVAVLDRDEFSVGGLILAWHLIILLYWGGFAYFFSLEVQETLLTVAIIGVLQAIQFVALWKM